MLQQKQLIHTQSTTKLTIILMSYIIHSLNQRMPNACRRLCSKERKSFPGKHFLMLVPFTSLTFCDPTCHHVAFTFRFGQLACHRCTHVLSNDDAMLAIPRRLPLSWCTRSTRPTRPQPIRSQSIPDNSCTETQSQQFFYIYPNTYKHMSNSSL